MSGLIFTKEYWYPAHEFGLYRPLTTLSYLLNYSLLGDGPHPPGYHLINLALHDLNILAGLRAWVHDLLGGSAPALRSPRCGPCIRCSPNP